MTDSPRAKRSAVLAFNASFAALVTPGHAQVDSQERPVMLEEIIVTAIRVETNLQRTPMSVQAFTGDNLELGGIDHGRDLGIMVPNVALNPDVNGERAPKMIIRGLPGVATYMDGIFIGNWGFLQRSFVEFERVEVLRGPQGTLFGRNSNGGAIQLITRQPAEEFGARFDVELGEFDRRTLKLAVDVPISDRLWTKWTAASDENEGFLESQTAPFSLGNQDDTLFRADILWQPADDFSLRVTAGEENRRSTDARIIRISNPSNPVYIAYNVLAGNRDYLAQARAIDDTFPDPPFALAGDQFTPETHQAGYPGGTLGQWQTRSDTPGPTTVADDQFVTLTLSWDVNDRWSLESLTSYASGDFLQISDYDASEFTLTTFAQSNEFEAVTQELHLIGEHFGDRLRTLLGAWYNRFDGWVRGYGWGFWEFAIPNTGPNPPLPNMDAVSYVRAWGATVGNPAVANFVPNFAFTVNDYAGHRHASEEAVFGEVTIGLLDRLDLTLGFRYTGDEEGAGANYLPGDAFRPMRPGTVPPGDTRAVAAILRSEDLPDLGTVSSPRVSIAYEPTDTIYVYASYAEGFTQGEIVNHPLVPDPIILDPEVVKTREIGLRSDWLSSRLRFNATYFDSHWDGLRVPKRLADPNDPGTLLPFAVPTSDGLAQSSGFEVELYYLPAERWEIDFALGLLDTEYLDIGDPPLNGSGLQPGIPFEYAPETSYSLGVRYRLPLRSGGQILFAGKYGWMDEYQRASSNEFQPKNPDGSPKFEPSYGILNGRIVYEPGDGDWRLSLFGTNLTDEWYVDGGIDTGLFWGYDFGTIGRPREVGIGLQFVVD